MTAQEIADRLLDHPQGATPERLAKAMALAERSRRPGLFREALQLGLEARGTTLELATIRAGHRLRREALLKAHHAALNRKENDPVKPLLLAYVASALPAHDALLANLEAETPRRIEREVEYHYASSLPSPTAPNAGR